MSSISQDLYSLSPQQKCAWASRGTGRAPGIQIACEIEGELDRARLRTALQGVIRRHEILRSRFVPMPGLNYPAQAVEPDSAAEQFDAVSRTPGEDMQEIANLLDQEAKAHGNGESEFPVRATLVPVNPAKHILIVSAPGTCADAATLQQFIREAAELYGAGGTRADDGELPLQYVEYASWREETAAQNDEVTQQGRAYWDQQMKTRQAEVRIAGQPARNGHLSSEFVPFQLTADIAEKLGALNRTATQPLEAVLLACWSLFLYRRTESPVLEVGVVLDGRSVEEFRNGMGPYAQVLPVLMQLSSATDLNDATASAYEHLVQASLWQDYYVPPDPTSSGPTAGVFGYSFTSNGSAYWAEGLRFRSLAPRASTYPFELKLECFHNGEEITGALAYHTGSFTAEHVGMLARQFEAFCEFLATHPNEAIARVNVFTEGDTRRLLAEWNETDHPSVPTGCIPEFFEQQAARTPNEIAVDFRLEKITFRELSDRTSSLAKRLRNLGVGPDVPVCLFVEPSVEMIVGLLSILKASGAYVPLEIAYPVKERIEHIVRETRAPVIVARKKLQTYLDGLPARIVYLDEPVLENNDALQRPTTTAIPENIAYIIYTSGSTGRPKGVMVQHRSVINLWYALQREVYSQKTGHLRVSVNAPISFDAAVKQIVTLLGGHTLCVIPEDVRTNPHAFIEYIREHRIDVLDCTPSHLSTLLEAGLEDGQAGVPSLALIGGEAIDEQLWLKLASSRTTFYNVYGPTECTVDSTAIRVSTDSAVSIGRPLSNVKSYVLNEKMEMVSPGVPGELCIAGRGVARGYWGAPTLTAERFVPNPFAAVPGARLYLTGDLVRYLPDGSLEYRGRIDHQVKVRGFRVELGEIAAALAEHSGIKEAVVHAFKDSGNTRLVGYVVPRAPGPAPAGLREFLESRLPEYMIPVSFVSLESLPINANGKLDRKALPDPGAPSAEPNTEFRAPSGEVEIALARIWSAVLNREEVGICDNFFQLGGHSLLAMRMIARVRKQFAIDIPLPRLFQLPTIEALARVIEEAVNSGATFRAPITSVSRSAPASKEINPTAA